jgi:hypothetical protein
MFLIERTKKSKTLSISSEAFKPFSQGKANRFIHRRIKSRINHLKRSEFFSIDLSTLLSKMNEPKKEKFGEKNFRSPALLQHIRAAIEKRLN